MVIVIFKRLTQKAQDPKIFNLPSCKTGEDRQAFLLEKSIIKQFSGARLIHCLSFTSIHLRETSFGARRWSSG